MLLVSALGSSGRKAVAGDDGARELGLLAVGLSLAPSQVCMGSRGQLGRACFGLILHSPARSFR